jgi:predicted site-specific integrase-resolvase
MNKYTLPTTAVLEIHNISRQELYRWIRTGKIRAEKRGQPQQWHFIPEEVEKLRQERVQLLEVQRAQIMESVEDWLSRQY